MISSLDAACPNIIRSKTSEESCLRTSGLDRADIAVKRPSGTKNKPLPSGKENIVSKPSPPVQAKEQKMELQRPRRTSTSTEASTKTRRDVVV